MHDEKNWNFEYEFNIIILYGIMVFYIWFLAKRNGHKLSVLFYIIVNYRIADLHAP